MYQLLSFLKPTGIVEECVSLSQFVLLDINDTLHWHTPPDPVSGRCQSWMGIMTHAEASLTQQGGLVHIRANKKMR